MILSNNDRKIKTIELTNFMNHVYTKIDLEDGILEVINHYKSLTDGRTE